MGEKPTGATDEGQEDGGEGTSDTGGEGIVRRPDGTIRSQTPSHQTGA